MSNMTDAQMIAAQKETIAKLAVENHQLKNDSSMYRFCQKALDEIGEIVAPGVTFHKLSDLIAMVKERARTTKSPQAATDVLAERRRQVEVEGWTPKHDDSHTNGAMAIAAAYYAAHDTDASVTDPHDVEGWVKPTTTRRNLVKAGALILAEIERLDRAERR